MVNQMDNVIIEEHVRDIKLRFCNNGDAYFRCGGETYYLSQFKRCNNRLVESGFDGILQFRGAGLLIRLLDGRHVKIYRYRIMT